MWSDLARSLTGSYASLIEVLWLHASSLETLLCLLGPSLLVVIVIFCSYRTPADVAVECWFCGAATTVPTGNRNCWDCPSCQQYNGFKEDGDYNKPIPAQSSECLNFPVLPQQLSPSAVESETILCSSCQQNQLLKMSQLAKFQPLDERNYDQEVELYRQMLESVYKLCPVCQSRVNKRLKQQDEILQRKLRADPTWMSRSVASKRPIQTGVAHLLPPTKFYETKKFNELIRCLSILVQCLAFWLYFHQHWQFAWTLLSWSVLVILVALHLNMKRGSTRSAGVDVAAVILFILLIFFNILKQSDKINQYLFATVSASGFAISFSIQLISLLYEHFHRSAPQLRRRRKRSTGKMPVTTNGHYHAATLDSSVEKVRGQSDESLDSSLGSLSLGSARRTSLPHSPGTSPSSDGFSSHRVNGSVLRPPRLAFLSGGSAPLGSIQREQTQGGKGDCESRSSSESGFCTRPPSLNSSVTGGYPAFERFRRTQSILISGLLIALLLSLVLNFLFCVVFISRN